MIVPSESSNGRKTRVLILDDEPIVCKRLKPAFQKAGYEVEAFTDSAQAMARVEEEKFDIIITDLKMEGIDGMQFLTHIKEIAPETGIIVITGFATAETARQSLREGAFDFVAKPFKLSDILETMRVLEERIRSRQV